MTGHEVIEAALLKASKYDHNNSPFGMEPTQGVAYQMGLAAAYMHALEMIPDESVKRSFVKVWCPSCQNHVFENDTCYVKCKGKVD
jgi:hypothetical protein